MKHLAFGPGAMGFFMYMGALSALSDKGALNDLESLSGASAGGLISYLYIITHGNVQAMFDYSMDIPVGNIMKLNIKTLTKSYGLVSTKKIRKVLEDANEKFLKRRNVTFKELYDLCPIKLHIAACCVDLKTTHYFSVDTTPTVSVIDTLCMTIAIPFLFESVKHGPWHYIDGGALEDLPCGPYVSYDSKHVFAIGISGEWSSSVHDLKSYAFEILGTAMHLRHKYNFRQLRFDPSEHKINVFDFNASWDSKIKMFTVGYNLALKVE